MLAAKPTINLFAETGGKNATIVTALSDRDQAIKNVLHSAFSHSGQKCSATSLLILESEVYHDARFREAFCDAVESLRVGSAWDLPTKIGPLIRPPTGELESALKDLEPGEEWAVMPRLHIDDNPHLVSPGVKWGVRNGSVTHCTEFFGPLLARNGSPRPRRSDRPGERDRLWPHFRPRKSRRPRAGAVATTHPRRQSLHQPPHHRCDRPPPTVRRHGQEQRRPRHQSRRPELRRAADAI